MDRQRRRRPPKRRLARRTIRRTHRPIRRDANAGMRLRRRLGTAARINARIKNQRLFRTTIRRKFMSPPPKRIRSAVGQYADSIAEELRQAEIRTMRHLGGGNLSKQLKKPIPAGRNLPQSSAKTKCKKTKLLSNPCVAASKKRSPAKI